MCAAVKARFPALLLVLALVAGCGDDDKSSSDSASTTADTTAQKGASIDTSKKPKVTVPKGTPPAGLQIKDIKVGDGQTAQTGDTVTVQYVGVSYSTGKQFDASWDHGQPFQFTIGAGDVIPGWDQGVAGMQVGGRRELIIPPDLGYGAQGQPPVIAPNETLVFVIDLLKVG